MATPLVKRILYPLWREFRKGFNKKMDGDKQAKLGVKLLQAGNPFGMTLFEYRLIQLLLVLVLPVIAGGWGFLMGFSFGGILFSGILALIISIVLPPYYIKSKIHARSKSALKELPDVLDLLTVSLEAGLGFDGALSKVVLKKEGVLSTEFHRCLEEIRLGKTRRDSLRGVRERLVVDELNILISSILQAEKLGMGLVNVLRVQSEEVRDQRKQRAEQEAMKAPVKMLFPLVLFIFPSLFIVLLGPAIIQFIESFNK
ncbi:type II secretion system F family protein [Pseudalkalibacillus berkeleyi]|uniref:Type II secretion system F family protein n=1 Tax=Pseudalkalibacillus berkeleyi TaxID=1069813 RepID=A0ABS9H320_9BACL|nr:type II secretion system F family protein [Pseudalkalibacillus berkeleyi]MCF6139284.1 type II secretion system F family protein [Pseudalkalibacillus berkeleyi]